MTDDPLDSASLDALCEAARSAPGLVSLGLHLREDGGDFQARLRETAHRLREATDGAVAVVEGGGAEPLDAPALTIRVGGRDAVHYLALPEGPEEAPFLETLAALLGDAAEGDLADRLAPVTDPVEILVFVAAGCPNCPHGVRAANALAAASPHVTVTVVDAFHFGELAARYQVKSVPTTVVDGGLTLIGVKPVEELARHLAEREGPGAEKAVFISLVESGRFPDAARELVEGRGLETFAELWGRSALESRIGLTLIAQEALDEDPSALNDLVPLLLPSLQDDDPARQGDTADLLGAIGHPAAKDALETLLESPNPDVAEAAADALEELE